LRKLLAMDAEELEFTGVRTNRPNRCKYESE
jgi:hypothetical protein